MSNPSSLSDRLSHALSTPSHGVLALVDELLAGAQEQDIQLCWQAGLCQVRISGGEPPEEIAIPLQKSVMRAVLARVAALCTEQIPNSVSPYRGFGKVVVNQGSAVRVMFVNTSEEQSLELSRMRTENEQLSQAIHSQTHTELL